MAANEDLWTATDHDNDGGRLYPVTGCGSDGCVAGLHLPGAAIHLDREALADLVRAAAPLAGLTVVEDNRDSIPSVPAGPAPGAPAGLTGGMTWQQRAEAAQAVWSGRRRGEDDGWLWDRTVDVAHYIATGEVSA